MKKIVKRISEWWREPFVRFMLLGLLLFAADRFINGPLRANDAERLILIEVPDQQALRNAFRSERGREPTSAEWQARLDQWIDDQVLYREALALGLDRKDVIVRRQLTQKMRFLLEDASPLPEPTELQLQDWLANHAARYERPPTVGFEHVFLSRGRHGDQLDAQARSVRAQLDHAPEAYTRLGDPFPTGALVADANPTQVRREFGPEFAKSLQGIAPGQWTGPIHSSFGLHFVRVIATSAPQAARLQDVREQVRADFQAAQHEERTRAAIENLRQRYRIEIEKVSP